LQELLLDRRLHVEDMAGVLEHGKSRRGRTSRNLLAFMPQQRGQKRSGVNDAQFFGGLAVDLNNRIRARAVA
jgi:hypothetical protein